MFGSQRKTITWSDVRIGLFVFTGLILVLATIFFIQPGKRFGATFKVRSVFSSVGGLTKGAPVTMSGVQVGTVSDLRILRQGSEINEFPSNKGVLKALQAIQQQMQRLDVSTPAGNQAYRKLQRAYAIEQTHLKQVSVLMEVAKDTKDLIGADSIAWIKNQGLVGDKFIDITTSGPGSPKLSPVADSTGVSAVEIRGQEPTDINAILQNASGAAGSVEELMANVNTNITEGKGTIGKLIKDPSVHNNLNATLKETSRATKYSGDILQSVRQGKGTVGKLFNDPSLFNSANGVMGDIQNSRGTLGLLIHNPSAYNNMDATMRQMNDVAYAFNHGNGTIQKLIHDASLYRNTDSLMQGTADLIARTNRGEGSLGRLTRDDALYRNATNAMAGLAAVTDKINRGEGSIGILMKDRKIADNLTEFSQELVTFIKEVRKNPRKYLTMQINVVKLF